MKHEVLGRPVTKVPGRMFLTHSCAPLDLMAQHGAKSQCAPTCPICGSFFAIQATGGYTVWRPQRSFEVRVGDGPVKVLPDTDTRGISLDLQCELGHEFSLHVVQLFADEPLCFDLIPKCDTYEAFPDQLYEEGRHATASARGESEAQG